MSFPQIFMVLDSFASLFFSNKKCFYTIGLHYVLPKVWHYIIAFKKAIHKYSIMKCMVESPDQAYLPGNNGMYFELKFCEYFDV